jgi:hypothetical protein
LALAEAPTNRDNASSRDAAKSGIASGDSGSSGGRLRCSTNGFTNAPFFVSA